MINCNRLFLFAFALITVPFVTFSLPQQPQQGGGEVFQGEGTYYYPNGGTGFCGAPLFDDHMVGALGEQFLGKVKCGQCLEVTAGSASVVVQIADKCAACKMGDVDLTPDAFKLIQGGSLTAGRIKITSKLVPCPKPEDSPQ